MTIDETIDNLEWIKHCLIADSEQDKAVDMAIASLEAWQKVRQDIQTETDDKSNNMFFNLGMLGALAIINKHLQGVKE